MKRYEVSKEAHHRGYGSQEEVCLVNVAHALASSFDVAQYLDLRLADGFERKERKRSQ
jgi:hypothetical protein